MNVLATAEAWVAANQTTVMISLVVAFVAFHLFLLAKTAVADLANDTEETTNADAELWAEVYATPWLM